MKLIVLVPALKVVPLLAHCPPTVWLNVPALNVPEFNVTFPAIDNPITVVTEAVPLKVKFPAINVVPA